MEDANSLPPPESPNSLRDKIICELDALLESLNLTAQPLERDLKGDVKFVELFKEYEIGDFSDEEIEEGEIVEEEEVSVEYFDKFTTRSELTYHKYLLYEPIRPLLMRRPIIVGGSPLSLKTPCNIGHVYIWKAYIDLNSLINIMTRMQCNWIMKRQLKPRNDPKSIRGISNFTRRVRGMHIFVRNFTYVLDFLIVEDINSVIEPSLSQIMLGNPFVKLSNMTYDSSLGIVKFTNKTNEIACMMPYKIEQFKSLSNIEKEHKQSVYNRNEKDKRRGVNYVMNKILGFYKECLKLGPEYLTGLDRSRTSGGVTQGV
ncbi:hypothetical protein Tco_1382885 [Tanacetum coccineum]